MLNPTASEERAGRKMFDASFDSAVIGKAIVAPTGHCTKVNAALAAMLGYSTNSLTGMHFREFTHPSDVDADLELFQSVMRGERESYHLEKRYVRSDGAVLEVLLSATCVRDDAGRPMQFISEIVDLTDRNRARRDLEDANSKLRLLVVTDHVTGLYNRRGFEENMIGIPDGVPLGVLMIDLDNFKAINDRLGHSAGDLVLREVARRLLPQVRIGDTVARVGGDEFGILLRGADRRISAEVAARVVRVLADAYEVKGQVAQVGASVGVSCTLSGSDLNAAVRLADKALYAAKHAGKGQWRFAA